LALKFRSSGDHGNEDFKNEAITKRSTCGIVLPSPGSKPASNVFFFLVGKIFLNSIPFMVSAERIEKKNMTSAIKYIWAILRLLQ
jgi:hypothetical protein